MQYAKVKYGQKVYISESSILDMILVCGYTYDWRILMEIQKQHPIELMKAI
jgi:hypothetical protein